MSKVKVLIIDDSALVRQVLTSVLESNKNIAVVGTAKDPFDAREKIKNLRPDVLTLDIEMPKMDGVTFLKNLMRLRPMPVVMISSLTEQGAEITLEALESGAIDFVSKPKIDVQAGLNNYAEEIIEKVLSAAKSRVRERVLPVRKIAQKLTADAVLGKISGKQHFKTTDKIIAIGASTGGTEAIREVLEAMPADAPGMVISQHIPAAFSAPFALRMNKVSKMTVCEAEDGQKILPGHVYIAPGDRHLIIERSGAQYICRLNDGPAVNRHKPSVDVMFRSIAKNVGPNALGLILTGMGDDGALGLKEIREQGGATMVQDEQTSVVWGMPGAAAKIGAAQQELALEKIAGALVKYAKEPLLK
jgi:two-component system chemotaxis response regulator CheB